ncbi:MAG: hypothetical protein JOZ62_21315 [Acidobacteriaceae bacterium]|nr:hypothetical protein [Acidobacteriaceae bacterium]
MSQPPHKPHTLVHFEGPKQSEPHEGHEHTRFEGIDASVKVVIGSLAIIWLTLIITGAIVFPIQNILKHENPPGNLPSPMAPARVLPPTPVIQVRPWETLPDLRAHEEEVLNSYGKDNTTGHTHVPINQAMDAVMAQLKIQPNAPAGLTVPGGQGRDFAKGLSAMPPEYQRPTIQGEIRKNAQASASR